MGANSETVPAGARRVVRSGVLSNGIHDQPASTRLGLPGVPSPGPGSYEDLQQQLKARGVVWQQLRLVDPQRDEWDFICAIPNPQQNNLRRNYTTRAVGPSGLAAIRAVLEEIDRDRR